jgi:hypothetical protein
MDYARFNYVAQPEDNISRAGIFPRIGDYDKWAIEWGYKNINAKNEEDEKNQLSKLFIERYKANPRIWFGTYESGNSADARTQSEDLGDNAMKASEYGIKNLKRIVPNLNEWTKEPSDNYSNLSEMYGQVVFQYQRYLGHVARNIGGYYETYKSVEQEGNIFEATPKAMQKDAVSFLQKNLFETPSWLIDNNILNKINSPTADQISSIQDGMLGSLLSSVRLGRMITAGNRFENTYSIDEYFSDLKKGIWSEIPARKKIDNYRRNLQKSYVERMISLLNPTSAPVITSGFTISFGPDTKKTDISSLVRAHLNSLKTELAAAAPSYTDNMSRYHLQDLSERIKQALNPNN